MTPAQAVSNAHNVGYRDGYAGARANPPAWETIPEWSNAYADGYALGQRAARRIKPQQHQQGFDL